MPDRCSIHLGVAAGCADAATLLTNHAELASVSQCLIHFSHLDDVPQLNCVLHPSSHELVDLCAWANALDVDTISVRRYTSPYAYTVVAAHGEQGASLVTVSTQPSTTELDALEHAIGHRPDVGVSETVPLSTLHQAANEARHRNAVGDAA